MKHIIDTHELEKLIKGKIDLYDSQMEGADYDDFIRNEWAAGAMRQLLKDLRALIANSPQADGMVLENYESLPKLGGGIYKHEKLGELYDRLQVQQYAVKYCDVISSLLSAYKPQADDVRKDAWISVEDRLPLLDGVSIPYLTVTKDNWYRIISFNGEDFPSQVTHWQPLPSPPLDKARE